MDESVGKEGAGRPLWPFERSLLLWTLVALVVRLLWIALEPGNRIVADEGAWLAWGLDVLPAPDVRFSPFRAQMIFHPPLYPYFIGIVAEVFGGLGAVKVAQALVGALLVPAVGLLGKRGFGRRAGLYAAAFVALYPELVWFAAHFWAETLFATVVWWAFERYTALLGPPSGTSLRGRVGLALLTGLLLGFAILTRETVLYLLPFMALGLAWRRGWRDLLTAAAFFFAALAVVTPWTWRNHEVFGAFVPVSTSGGLNLYQGNARLTRQQVYDEWHAVRGRIAKYEFARKKGIEVILERQPWWIFEKLEQEMPDFWEADSQALVHVRRGAYGEPRLAVAVASTAVVVIPYLVLLVFFAVGIAVLPRGPVPVFVLGFLAYYTLLHVATHGYARYRLPALPALFLVAGSALSSLGIVRWRHLTAQRRWATLLTALLLCLSVLPSLRFLVRADTLVSENARFGLDPQGRPLDGEREGGGEP